MTTLQTNLIADAAVLRRITDQLLAGKDLNEDDARALLVALADDDVPDPLKGALLGAMRVKGETADEVRGLALAMRDLATPLPGSATSTGETLVDTCGTGGDGSHSLNVSTATALLAAACGQKVAKHGNRSVSSKSGSADVLDALGVVIPDSAEAARAQLDRAGFTFLFAPLFHGATKGVAAVRRAIGARTVFNVLGPLTNPARPQHQLVGAYDLPTARRMAEALAGMGVVRAAVVHGAPSWDEATPIGPFHRFGIEDGRVREQIIDPAELGLPRCTPDDLRGGSPEDNAQRLEALLAGKEHGAHRDTVLLNTGLVLELTGAATDLRDGIARARAALDSGAGTKTLQALRSGGAA